MESISEQLKTWITENMCPLTETRLQAIPVSKLDILTEGKNKRIWKFVIEHVRCQTEVQRIRRILEIKRSRKDLEKLYPSPSVDAGKIREEIEEAKVKRSFLQKSLEKDKECLLEAESALRNRNDEISVWYQRIAVEDVLFQQYKKKTLDLKFILNKLRAFEGIGFCRQNADSIFQTNKNPKQMTVQSETEIEPLILHAQSTILKKLDIINNTEYTTANLVSKIKKSMKDVHLIELISSLDSLAKKSHSEALEELTSPVENKEFDRTELVEYLQSLKSENIEHHFNARKISKEADECSKAVNMELNKVKSSLDSNSPDFNTQCSLLEIMAKNKGMEENIRYLEDLLTSIQNEMLKLKAENSTLPSLQNELQTVVTKYYKKYDASKFLQEKAQDTFDVLLKLFEELYTFANNEAFTGCTDTLKNYYKEAKGEMEFVHDQTWELNEKENILKSVIDTKPIEPVIPTNLYQISDIRPYQNFSVLCRLLFNVKQYLHQKDCRQTYSKDADETIIDADSEKDMEMLKMIGSKLDSCEEHCQEISAKEKKVETVLSDWWEQPAQDVMDFEYEGKTLKMWRDVISVMPDF